MTNIQIEKVTREKILPLVSSSSVLSPYETECDDIFYLLSCNGESAGYISGRETSSRKILTNHKPEKVYYINGMEIIKGYKGKGLGTLLFERFRKDCPAGQRILLYATRFSAPFWMKWKDADVIGEFGKGKYIIFG